VAIEHVTKRKNKRTPAPLVRVTFVDHAMSAHPHWHDGALPPPPTAAPCVCVAVGYLTFASDEWVQVLHVATTGQHGHYSDIARACVQAIEPLNIRDE
jgi:hypothetical protein